MTEIEYVLENFNDRFASMHDKRILLHGSRNYAEAILRRFGKEFNFTGVMSMDPLAEEVWNGLPVFREGDLPGRVDLVILTERVKYEEAAFLSLRRSCRKNRIEIYNMYGQDEFALHLEAGSAEPLCLEGALQRCLPYDIVSFEVIDTVFPTAMGQVGFPNELFLELIPALRAMGKELRFSLRKSFSEDEQIRALKESGFLAEESELIRRKGEDLSFRSLKESAPGKRILYFGSGLVNEVFLPRCYGIDSVRFLVRGILEFEPRLPDDTASRMTPVLPGQRDSILDQIRRHSVISFDVFDTLLIRKTLYPRDVFLLTEQKIKNAGYRAEGFAVSRARIENDMPLRTLDDIYGTLAERYGWDTETEERVKRMELDVERSVLEPRPAVVELMEFALREGKRVVLTTDMYLPESVLRMLLEDKGIRGFDRILVSCDCGSSKLYELYSLLVEYSGDAGEILHIGDNPESDGNAPPKNGIDSIVIPSPLALAKCGSWSNAVSSASTLMERCLLGMVLSRICSDPFQDPDLRELPITERMRYMGNSVIGPLIAGHTCWMIRKLLSGRFDGVLFFARDGWLPLKAYEKAGGEISLPPGYYFHTNRRAAFLCCADEQSQADRMADFGKSNGLTVNQLLQRAYMIPPEKQLPHDDRELNAEYIEKHMPIIHEIAERSRKGYARYAKKLGLRAGGNYAVVDFISAGTTQKALSQTFPFSLHGLYYGTYFHEKKDDPTFEYYLRGENPELLRTYLDLETIFSSPEPSLDHISEQGTPVYQKENRSDDSLFMLQAAWDAAEAFAAEFFDLFYTKEQEIAPRFIEEIYAAGAYLGLDRPAIDDWLQIPLRKRRSSE